MKDLPDYIEKRIRRGRPAAGRVVAGSTPVVAFGDLRKARVATLGWNPSKHEFLDRKGNELADDERRLETLKSLGEQDLARAPAEAVRRVFEACNNYFHHHPDGRWFNKLERILTHVRASYCDDSACHLDLVQWATDPVWRDVPELEKGQLIDADLPFLRRQLSQENFQLLLLNGTGIMEAYERHLGGKLTELSVSDLGRWKLFAGNAAGGLKAVGWNINLQAGFGVSIEEIERIGAAVAVEVRKREMQR
ncbi:MAG: hypothetical protein ABSD30_22840 [Candidatus Binatus sp.]|jgi:hypothetical protein